MKALPPACHHNLLDAAAQVGALEVQLGYTFKNRMTCIQALKVTGTWSPLYFDGTVYSADKNNRLALLGDRVLSLAICEIWYHTEHSTSMCNV
jgi:dsRNA-specific ribonuclease